jgi:hypothetical protein
MLREVMPHMRLVGFNITSGVKLLALAHYRYL